MEHEISKKSRELRQTLSPICVGVNISVCVSEKSKQTAIPCLLLDPGIITTFKESVSDPILSHSNLDNLPINYLRWIVTLSYLCIGLWRPFQVIHLKFSVHFYPCHMPHAPLVLDVFTLVMYDEQHRPWSLSLRSHHELPVTSSLSVTTSAKHLLLKHTMFFQKFQTPCFILT
jgi:hypothetical protein